MSDPEPESSPSENQYMVSPGIPSIVEEENTGKSRLESELENQIKEAYQNPNVTHLKVYENATSLCTQEEYEIQMRQIENEERKKRMSS